MSDASTTSGVRYSIEVVWKHESARLIAGIARVSRDIGIAEVLAQDAFVSALEDWQSLSLAVCRMQLADWRSIVVLYDALLKIKPSPVTALNRVVALAMVDGPAAGLAAVDALDGLSTYHLLPSVRGVLLTKLGRNTEAREELQRAISMTDNLCEKQLLTKKLNAFGRNDRKQPTRFNSEQGK